MGQVSSQGFEKEIRASLSSETMQGGVVASQDPEASASVL